VQPITRRDNRFEEWGNTRMSRNPKTVEYRQREGGRERKGKVARLLPQVRKEADVHEEANLVKCHDSGRRASESNAHPWGEKAGGRWCGNGGCLPRKSRKRIKGGRWHAMSHPPRGAEAERRREARRRTHGGVQKNRLTPKGGGKKKEKKMRRC